MLTVTAMLPGTAVAGIAPPSSDGPGSGTTASPAAASVADGPTPPARTLAAGGGPLPDGTVTDATEDRAFAGGYQLVVADVTYPEAGAVTNVTVDLAGGADGDVSPAAVDSVSVRLVNTSTGITREAGAVSYDGHGVTVESDGEATDVDRVVICVKVADRVTDGARIDASYALSNDTATRSHDTEGVQTARTANAGFVLGTVVDDDGNPVEDATVELIEVDSEETVTTLRTDEDGEFGPQQVVANRTYTAKASKFGYVADGFAKRASVGPNETESIPVTLELRLAADGLRIAPADLGDPDTTEDDRLLEGPVVLPADDRSSTAATFVAVVENTSAESPDGLGISLFEVNVTLAFANDTGVGDFLDNDRIDREITVRTTLLGDIDGDGNLEAYAPFTVTADAANGTSMFRAAVTETIRGSFVNALGDRIVSVGVEGANGTTYETSGNDGAAGEPAFAVSNLTVPDTATEGEPFGISATVTNENDTAGTRTVEVRLDQDGDGTLASGETLASRNVTLDGGESERVTFEVTPELAGEFEVGIVTEDDAATTTVTVADSLPGPAADYDADGDGRIDTGELRAAIGDWAADVITTDELNVVVGVWASGG